MRDEFDGQGRRKKLLNDPELFFKFKLADRWGCSVEELEDRLPQWELPYWYAFYRLEPFGGDVQDTQFAQLCCLFANANRNPKKSRAFKVEDFKLAIKREQGKAASAKEGFYKMFHMARLLSNG